MSLVVTFLDSSPFIASRKPSLLFLREFDQLLLLSVLGLLPPNPKAKVFLYLDVPGRGSLSGHNTFLVARFSSSRDPSVCMVKAEKNENSKDGQEHHRNESLIL